MSDVEDDKSLEEFFAKKSKGKKSKIKSKPFTTSKDIAEKKSKTKGKTEEKTEAVTKEVSQDEEQWKDFEAPQELDVSGLRVQSLQKSDEKEKDEDNEATEETGDDEDDKKREKMGGPWAVSASSQSQAPPAAEVNRTAKPAKTTEKYVPGAFSLKTKKERSGVPPDITSQAAFPSLSNAAQSSTQKSGDFEVVKRGTKPVGTAVDSRPTLNTENRYDSLRT